MNSFSEERFAELLALDDLRGVASIWWERFIRRTGSFF